MRVLRHMLVSAAGCLLTRDRLAAAFLLPRSSSSSGGPSSSRRRVRDDSLLPFSPLPFLEGRRAVSEVEETAAVSGTGSKSLSPPTVLWGRKAAKVAERKAKFEKKKQKLNAFWGKKIVVLAKRDPNPETNKELKNTMKAAIRAGCPAENVEKARTRGQDKDVGDFSEVIYEAYGAGGVGMIFTCLTDNPKRLQAYVNQAINRRVKLANKGSVAFNFRRLGCITVTGEFMEKVDEDAVLEAGLEAGADDIFLEVGEEDGEKKVDIFTEIESLNAVKMALEAIGIEGSERLVWKPNDLIDCSDEDYDLNMDVMDSVSEVDDVDSVEFNMRVLPEDK